MIVDVSLRPSARLTRHHRGEHKIRLYRAATIGWSQPFVDCSNEDGGLEADRRFVEAVGHRPVPRSLHLPAGLLHLAVNSPGVGDGPEVAELIGIDH